MEHIFVNKNIRLENVKLSMAAEIFSTIDRDREYLKKWLPFVEMTYLLSDTEKFIQSVIKQKGKKKDDIYCIYYREEFAGLIGFKETDWVNHKTELGYWIAEKMQGKGIVTDSIKKLISYTFQKLRLNRIQIKVAVGNTKSSAIPKRLGFWFEGIEKSGEYHKNKFFDLEIYSLLKKDWLNRKI
ncbi:MAG: GNAT family N-acetyltransferase [Prolixibacteraceae bacterium]|jgi:ribosomal-protein-serine acetyltransferase|nr:GNAT family N-acetyltransferase [Prolixibacteraceae bacterium]MBT6006479.1 GNAT family N-acetyltransferase [Prolixibacteraceae bacterium]MBT6766208.1 GNAT family N-acetyltransferase [Prolixibacteraceae bacterium]MBT6998947.1 GNAT family N-acetyltransferase [Prolixibacteraceae bacterium]MBT7393896.1 GNAT family N-acetyltransferase [Prolixibacteraceae bacterium]